MDRIFYVKSAKLRIKDAQEDKIVRARLLRSRLIERRESLRSHLDLLQSC